MAWNQEDYYQDPNQQYYDAYGYDQYYGYDPYDPYYGYYQEQPQEDTESMKLRKDQEEKERIEALESNRLYLKKIKKRCVKEDFADLDKLQLFLFEVMVESMEVNTETVLGLVPDNDQLSFISARVQFLNSPWMEICERDVMVEGSVQDTFETGYLQAIGEAGFTPMEKHKEPVRSRGQSSETAKWSVAEEGSQGGEKKEGEEEEEVIITTRWENASGKSCLFSETPHTIIQELEKYPVVLQAVRCVMSSDSVETCEPIGYARVRLPDEFSLSVIQSCKEGVILPVSSVHRETLDIRNVFGVKKGRVDLFIRLSSFGPAIITSFRASGQDRKYIFKPSPLESNFKDVSTSQPRSEVLKPIFTEEEATVGISVQKEYDYFQKPVLWKTPGDFNCGCKSGRDSLDGGSVTRYSSLGSLRLPTSSDLSLCKNVLPPSVFRKLKFEQPICDWHNLVSTGIKNSPGGNCGCLDSPQDTAGEKNIQRDKLGKLSLEPANNDQNDQRTDTISSVKRVSRLAKILPKSGIKTNADINTMKGCTDCGCDCPLIKDSLDSKKLFLI